MAMPKGELEAKLKEEHEMISKGILREENPLDLTDDFNKFLECCRLGDLKGCQEYIASGGNINGKDAFDYTPLIIASLCGHFEGERCIHNALNDRIRNLLLEYDYSKSSDPLQPWAAHITSLLVPQVPKTSDITLTSAGGYVAPSNSSANGYFTGSQEFQLHKFLLAARTPYFRHKLTEAPDLATYRLSSQVPAPAFRIVLRYLYLADLTPNAKSGGVLMGGGGGNDDQDDEDSDSEEDILRAVDRLSKQLEVEQLWEAMLAGNDRRLARQRYEDEVRRAQNQLVRFFRDDVLGHKMVVDTNKADEVKWPHDNFIFADCILRADEVDDDEGEVEEAENASSRVRLNSIPVGPMTNGGSRDSEKATETAPSQKQAAISEPKPKRSVLYPAHKAMLVRSDYFRTMFSSAFLEAQASEHLRIISVDCSPEVLEIVLSFLYTEEAAIPLEFALEVLYVADMMFLEKLKSKAAGIISTLGSGDRKNEQPNSSNSKPNGKKETETPAEDKEDAQETEQLLNIYDILHAAWELKVQRLEDFSAKYLAQRLENYIDDPEFAAVVLESANRLKTREETDTIELVDDIRYFLSERFRMRFEDFAFEEMEEETREGARENGQAEGVEQVDGKVDGAPKAEEVVGASENPEAAAQTTTQREDALPVTGVDGNNDDDKPAGVLRDLDGNIVEDEFDSDALNYQILTNKIDKLLERLGLDG